MPATLVPTYTRKTMTLTWRSRAGRVSTRRVELGHVRDDQKDFGDIALLNVHRSGEVVSYTVVPSRAA